MDFTREDIDNVLAFYSYGANRAAITQLLRQLDAANARADAAAGQMQVKPLIWVQPADERGYIATSVVGQYAVFDEGYPRWAFSQRGGYTYHVMPTFEAAKVAAQADYHRRITSALALPIHKEPKL